MLIRETENSIKIEIVSHLNQLNLRPELVSRVGGEQSVKGDSYLFPDVMIFDANGVPIQGWELKLVSPDINDNTLFENASKKAEVIEANSFLISDMVTSRLYIKESSNSFCLKEEWKLGKELSRDNIREHLPNIREHFELIFRYVIALMVTNEVRQKTAGFSGITQNFILRFMEENFDSHMQSQEQIYSSDATVKETYEKCWMEVESEFPNQGLLASFTRLGLFKGITTILFLSSLREVSAREKSGYHNFIDNPDETSFVEYANSVSEDVDFQNILTIDKLSKSMLFGLYNELAQAASAIRELNLQTINFDDIRNGLKRIHENKTKRVLGHYPTPKSIAAILLALVKFGPNQRFWDPCSGTGTIPYEAMQKLRGASQSIEKAYKLVSASDKYHVPVAATLLVMSEPKDYAYIKRVFQSDVLDIDPSSTFDFYDPLEEEYVKEKIGDFDLICSNLPFVRFETVRRFRQNNTSFDWLGNRRDLFADILIKLKGFLSKDGKIAVVISNSWMGTEWGQRLWEYLTENHSILYVITETSNPWFNDANIVSTILVLGKEKPKTSSRTRFATLNANLNKIEKLDFDNRQRSAEEIVNDIDISGGEFTTSYRVHSRQLNDYLRLNLSKRILFYKQPFWNRLRKVTLLTANFFDIARGDRWGNNAFYHLPTGDEVERSYRKPLIKSLGTRSYIATPDRYAFVCTVGRRALENRNHKKALSWIDRHHVDDWRRSNLNLDVNFITNLNPSDRLVVQRVKKRSLVDQRYITFSNCSGDADFLFCLLNSVISMLFIEFSGFPRGLGALDLNKALFSTRHRIPDPNLFSDEEKNKIIEEFSKIQRRRPRSLNAELTDQTRLKFESLIFQALGIGDVMQQAIDTLIQAVDDRTNRRRSDSD